jgi:ribosome biogenesis GTPase
MQGEIAVGDEVAVEAKGGSIYTVVSVLPRRTKLSRPDPGKSSHERVIVANVDAVVIVVSVLSPPLHPRLIDRYLIAIHRGGAAPVICVNKLDLVAKSMRSEELAKLAPYRALDVPIVECSASECEGIADLRQVLLGRMAAFVGHSGVGKSSLVNALRPELELKVGSVSEGYGRGTHTTTASSLWDLGDGTRVIDTPGIRSFGLWSLREDELPFYFPEFAVVGRCKFNDCSHTHEPICALKEAVESGEISRDRYDTYLRILSSLR